MRTLAGLLLRWRGGTITEIDLTLQRRPAAVRTDEDTVAFVRSLLAFRYQIINLWRRSLQRRRQKDCTSWERMTQLAKDFLPSVRILHPSPLDRFVVKHPRWEPSARIGPARICAGGAQ
jgi:hypothetical protein